MRKLASDIMGTEFATVPDAARAPYPAYVLMPAKMVNHLGDQFAGGLDKPRLQIFIRLMSLIN